MRKSIIMPVMLMMHVFFHSAFPINFESKTISDDGYNTRTVNTVDLDKDGDLDVLVADYSWNRVYWDMNNGNGTFSRITVGENDGVKAITADDMDKDGDIDIITHGAWFEKTGSTTFVRHSIGGSNGNSAHAVDLDKDGDNDIVTASSSVYWHENDGTQNFTVHEVYSDGKREIFVEPFDVDNDNDIDLLVSDNYNNRVVWLENDGAGTFTTHVIDSTAPDTYGLVIADMDGDGKKDILTSLRSSSSSYGDIVFYKYNSTGGAFTKKTFSWSGYRDESWDYISLSAGDIDDDGDLDLVMLVEEGIFWLKNNGRGSSTNIYTIRKGMEKECSVVAADVDGDSDVDVLTAIGYEGKSDRVTLYKSDLSLNLTSPGKDAQWLFGETRSITWSTNGRFAHVKISYKTSCRGSWIVLTSSTENDGSYEWTIPEITSDSCMISISDAADSNPTDYSDYFGIYFKPAAPTLDKPADTATGVYIPPVLEWKESSGARTYTLQISTVSDFSSLTFDTSGIKSLYAQPKVLEKNTTYYWRVNAANPAGASEWSDVRSFTTIVGAPNAPVLDSPSNNAVDQPVTLNLKWKKVSQASSYSLLVSTSSSISYRVVDRSGLTDTLFQVNNLSSHTKYYWCVRATNDGGTSNWSTAWYFTTVLEKPVGPDLAEPSNDKTNVPVNPVFRWHTTEETGAYTLQVSTTVDFKSLVTNEGGITDTLKSISGLSNNTKYFWRVNGTNASGTGSWSATWGFTTVVDQPDVPVLSSPSNNATDQPIPLTLSWNASENASFYALQVSTKSDFSTLVANKNEITSTSAQISGLDKNTKCYWRVNAQNAGGTSDWSTSRSFTTTSAIDKPNVPELLLPSNNATDQPVSLTLRWEPSVKASSYLLQISTKSDFSSPTGDAIELTATSKEISGLDNNTMYYWRVAAKNAAGTGDWSNIWSFTTIIDKPDVPELLFPGNGSPNVPVTVQFRWKPATDAESYHLHLSTSKSFNDATCDTSALTDAVLDVSGLSNETRYYWRVRAVNAGGTGAWSKVCSLTTIAALPQVVALVSPSADDVITSDSLRFIWKAAKSQVTTYRIDIAKDSLFTEVIVTDSTVTDTFKVVEAANNGKFWWRVRALNPAGWGEWSEAACYTVDKATKVVMPEEFRIEFNSMDEHNGKINYALPKQSKVSIRLYTLQGKAVSNLVNRDQAPGYYSVNLDIRLNGYFILVFRADNFIRQQKLLIMQ